MIHSTNMEHLLYANPSAGTMEDREVLGWCKSNCSFCHWKSYKPWSNFVGTHRVYTENLVHLVPKSLRDILHVKLPWDPKALWCRHMARRLTFSFFPLLLQAQISLIHSSLCYFSPRPPTLCIPPPLPQLKRKEEKGSIPSPDPCWDDPISERLPGCWQTPATKAYRQLPNPKSSPDQLMNICMGPHCRVKKMKKQTLVWGGRQSIKGKQAWTT